VILDPDEIQELTYARGIGTTTNNQDEALTLVKGIELAIDRGYRDLIIIGDSKILI